VRLTPKSPPGRSNRKALAFETEIARLHAQGYSREAIRQALADAGLTVSRSTVTREVAKVKNGKQDYRTPESASSIVSDGSASVPAAAPASAVVADSRSGKEIAAAWFRDHYTNPLVRAKDAHESGRH
jgi:hypothetical protein